MSVYRIFSDESRQTRDRYMVLAGIIINQDEISNFESTMLKYRTDNQMNSELKWSRVSNNKLEKYKIFVDYFFALCDTDKLHFKATIFDNHTVNHRKFSQGDKEIGFYKFYYILFKWFSRIYFNVDTPNVSVVIHPDHRSSKYNLGDLRDILNNGFNKDFQPHFRPYRAIEPLDSKKSEIIQVLDIILGAIGYVKNGYLLHGEANKAKVELCEYIRKKAGVYNLGNNTPYGRDRFCIWNVILGKK